VTLSAYTLIGLTAIVAALVGALSFAVLRVFAAAREASRGGQEDPRTACQSRRPPCG